MTTAALGILILNLPGPDGPQDFLLPAGGSPLILGLPSLSLASLGSLFHLVAKWASVGTAGSLSAPRQPGPDKGLPLDCVQTALHFSSPQLLLCKMGLMTKASALC